MSFKLYLQEAAFTQASIEKAILIIQKKLTKLLKTTLYRYGGASGTELLSGPDGKKYVSYLYFFNNTHAFRINTFRYNIMSIDVWKSYTPETAPQFTIHVEDLNSAQLMYTLDKIAIQIKNPHPEDIPLYFLPEEVELNEATEKLGHFVKSPHLEIHVHDAGKDKVTGKPNRNVSIVNTKTKEKVKLIHGVGNKSNEKIINHVSDVHNSKLQHSGGVKWTNQLHSMKESVLTEARRSTPQEFLHFAKAKLGDNANFARMSWQDIANVAAENDVQVPGFIRGQKNTDDPRGVNTFSIIPPGENPSTEVIDDKKEYDVAAKKKAEPILYIKVTAQDPETKKFLSTADSKQAQQLLGQIQKSLDSGEIPKEELQDPNTLYGHLTQLVTLVCKGKLKSLLVFGGPGTGKTFTIMKAITDAGLVSGSDFTKLSGKSTALGLYQTLFSFRENGLVIFDDIDSIWDDDGAVNILKAALDSYDKREISWSSNRTLNISKRPKQAQIEYMEILDKQLAGEDVEIPDEFNKDGSPKIHDKFKFPETFEFKGKIVFISNMSEEEFDTAVLSRTAKIKMDITPMQLLDRMRSILPILGGKDTPIEVKEEVLAYLFDRLQKKTLNMLTMREFVKTLAIANSGVPNWRELSKYA